MQLANLHLPLLTILLLGGLACGAAAQSTEVDIAARLVDKPLMLRGFWGDDKLKFDAAGQTPVRYMPVSFTICGMDVTKVMLRGDRLRIEGQRVALAWDHDGRMSRLPLTTGKFMLHTPEKISIEIDGRGRQDFTAALEAIFTDKLGDLVPSLPPYWQRYARTHFLPNTATGPIVGLDRRPQKAEVHEETSQKETAGQPPREVMHVGGSVKPPRVLKQTEAEFSEEARQIKYSGNTQVNLWVDEEGAPSHLQIARPTGVGLDEQAVRAVSSYVFVPAVKDNKAVKVDLYIEVNFQIF